MPEKRNPSERPPSDAEWYFRQAADEDRKLYYTIFAKTCKELGIRWASATEAEKMLVEAVTKKKFDELSKAHTHQIKEPK